MSTIEMPIEIWIMILNHLKIESNLKEKERLLNEKENDLNIKNDYLTDAAQKLENNLNDASILINHLAEIENKMALTIKNVDNLINEELTNHIENE